MQERASAARPRTRGWSEVELRQFLATRQLGSRQPTLDRPGPIVCHLRLRQPAEEQFDAARSPARIGGKIVIAGLRATHAASGQQRHDVASIHRPVPLQEARRSDRSPLRADDAAYAPPTTRPKSRERARSDGTGCPGQPRRRRYWPACLPAWGIVVMPRPAVRARIHWQPGLEHGGGVG